MSERNVNQVLSLSGIVLAGGQSRRLGQDKTLLRLWGPDGPTVLETTVSLLATICDELLIVTDRPRLQPPPGTRLVCDRYPDGGSMGGIYTGLLEMTHAHALVVACDMPFLNKALLSYMAGLPRDYDLLIPRHRPQESGQEAWHRFWLEPLHAIYGRPCLKPMSELLDRGERQITRFFPQVRVRYLEPEEMARFDPAGLSFRNINTPQDLEEATGMLQRW
jgi:molybdopterin-guanine dinucleotide biosynthesis protein A